MDKLKTEKYNQSLNDENRKEIHVATNDNLFHNAHILLPYNIDDML